VLLGFCCHCRHSSCRCRPSHPRHVIWCHCGSSTTSSPLVCTTLPPYEQLLVAEGCGVLLVGAGAGGGGSGIVSFIVRLPSLPLSLLLSGSTRDPSYEQLLVGMGACAVSSAGAWCGCGLHWQCAPAIHPTSSCSWAWGGCLSVVCHHCFALGKVIVGGYTRVGVLTWGSPCVPPVFCVPPPRTIPSVAVIVRHLCRSSPRGWGACSQRHLSPFPLKSEVKHIISIIK
jgi:hypothetical protein